jgi:hypothetical protein
MRPWLAALRSRSMKTIHTAALALLVPLGLPDLLYQLKS